MGLHMDAQARKGDHRFAGAAHHLTLLSTDQKRGATGRPPPLLFASAIRTRSIPPSLSPRGGNLPRGGGGGRSSPADFQADFRHGAMASHHRCHEFIWGRFLGPSDTVIVSADLMDGENLCRYRGHREVAPTSTPGE